MIPMTDVERFLPLRTELLFMLLVLKKSAAHGYGLIEAVASESRGEVRILTGSLYRFLGQLLDGGLIDEVAAPRGEDVDERRRYYSVTRLGRRVADAEIARLERLVGLVGSGRVRRAERAG
jgi:DNA-binding PadR family transcriptional regulator